MQHVNQTLWLDLVEVYTADCHGTCGDAIIYHEFPISFDLDIDLEGGFVNGSNVTFANGHCALIMAANETPSPAPNIAHQSDLRSNEQLRGDAEARAADADVVDNTERVQNPESAENENIKTRSKEGVDRAISELEEEQLMLEERQEFTSFLIRIGIFSILFSFGILMIFGIFALIFYAMDKAAAAFDFDISEYTLYIIVLLTLCNLMMSCFGCFGTYLFSEQYANDLRELDKVTASISRSADEINKTNDDLGDVFQRLEVEIMHFQGENQELLQSLKRIESAEAEFLKFRNLNRDGAWTLEDMKVSNLF